MTNRPILHNLGHLILGTAGRGSVGDPFSPTPLAVNGNSPAPDRTEVDATFQALTAS